LLEIAARPVEVDNQAGSDRIAATQSWQPALQELTDDSAAGRRTKSAASSGRPIGMIVAPAKIDDKVSALDEPGLLQPVSESGDKLRRVGSRRAPEKPLAGRSMGRSAGLMPPKIRPT
jgi:hypothetical protein